MRVILPDRSSRTLRRAGCTIDEILRHYTINPLEVIVTVNGRVVPEDTIVTEGDQIRILQIAHGG
jgi:thiamine biosynthesis protein ThiS